MLFMDTVNISLYLRSTITRILYAGQNLATINMQKMFLCVPLTFALGLTLDRAMQV